MADDADRAEDKIESQIECGIAHARHLLSNYSLKPCGVCYFCEAHLNVSTQLFCDKGCAEDYETQIKMRRISGK